MNVLDTSPLIIIIVTIFGATGFWELLRAIIEYKASKNDKITCAILALLRNELLVTCRRALVRQYTTVAELDNVVQLYNSYMELKGNGTVQEIYEDFRKLPCREFQDNSDIIREEGLV